MFPLKTAPDIVPFDQQLWYGNWADGNNQEKESWPTAQMTRPIYSAG